MENKITINVTQTDIDEGRIRNCYECPIAKAAYRSFPGAYEIAVGRILTVDLTGDFNSIQRYCIPDIARKFMNDFDCGKDVEPFSFEIG